MVRYARKLSVVGFALAAWYGYSRGRAYWDEWAFQQQRGEFPDPLTLAVGLAVFVLTVGFVVLLHRLAAPGPKRVTVRWLARLWVALGVCVTGGFAFVVWGIGTATQPPPSVYFSSVAHVISVAVSFAHVIFILAALPPLWVLSRRPR